MSELLLEKYLIYFGTAQNVNQISNTPMTVGYKSIGNEKNDNENGWMDIISSLLFGKY